MALALRYARQLNAGGAYMARRIAARHQRGRWAAQPSAAWPQRAKRSLPLVASVLGLTEWLPAPFTVCLGYAYHSKTVT